MDKDFKISEKVISDLKWLTEWDSGGGLNAGPDPDDIREVASEAISVIKILQGRIISHNLKKSEKKPDRG